MNVATGYLKAELNGFKLTLELTYEGVDIDERKLAYQDLQRYVTKLRNELTQLMFVMNKQLYEFVTKQKCTSCVVFDVTDKETILPDLLKDLKKRVEADGISYSGYLG